MSELDALIDFQRILRSEGGEGLVVDDQAGSQGEGPQQDQRRMHGHVAAPVENGDVGDDQAGLLYLQQVLVPAQRRFDRRSEDLLAHARRAKREKRLLREAEKKPSGRRSKLRSGCSNFLRKRLGW